MYLMTPIDSTFDQNTMCTIKTPYLYWYTRKICKILRVVA